MKYIATLFFFIFLAPVSVKGDADDLWNICLPAGGPLVIHCPLPGNSLTVNMGANEANGCRPMKLENHEGCSYWMPNSADRVDDFVFERVPLPLVDYQTRVVRDLIIMVPADQSEEVFLLSR